MSYAAFLDHYNYWISIALMMVGFYGVINGTNLVKKLIGMAIFQVSVLLFYISVGYIHRAAVPILEDSVSRYVNPLPHVLMLTAIVVGIATQAVGLALVVRIKKAYGTIEEDEIIQQDSDVDKYVTTIVNIDDATEALEVIEAPAKNRNKRK